MDLADRVALELETVGVLPPGERVVVGVSGGADSVCLLHVLQSLHVPVIVAHFDHGLRRSSWADGRYVLRLAAALTLPAVAERLEPGELAQGPGSLEERARRARYRFLASVAREGSCRFLAVGHTQDDQAETVLLHLLRGSGTRGLRGMRPSCGLEEVTGLPEDSRLLLIRPLLALPRAETLAYCRARRLSIRQDPTNAQTAFLRNRVRLELLPLLEGYNPAIRQSLAQTAEILAGDAEAIDALPALLESYLSRSPDGQRVEVPGDWLRGLPLGLQRIVTRWILQQVSPEGTEIGFRAVERARAGLASTRRTSLPGDVEVRAEEDRLVFGRSASPDPDLSRLPQLPAIDEISLEAPCTVSLQGGWVLEILERDVIEPIDDLGTDPRAEVIFDAEALGARLFLRAAAPGDRMTPFGAQGSKKIADLFQEHRIPVGARAAWPVVCGAESIAWLVGIRRAEGARVDAATRRILHLRLRAPGSGA
jgi:tRNA(Ile)-lysidine synthase